VRAGGQQARGHLFEYRVLGPKGLHIAREGASGLDNESTHPSSIA
jgi:hypothetical protein